MLSTEYVCAIPVADIIDLFVKGGRLKELYCPPRAGLTRWEFHDDLVKVYFQLEWKPYYRGELEPPMHWYIYDPDN